MCDNNPPNYDQATAPNGGAPPPSAFEESPPTYEAATNTPSQDQYLTNRNNGVSSRGPLWSLQSHPQAEYEPPWHVMSAAARERMEEAIQRIADRRRYKDIINPRTAGGAHTYDQDARRLQQRECDNGRRSSQKIKPKEASDADKPRDDPA